MFELSDGVNIFTWILLGIFLLGLGGGMLFGLIRGTKRTAKRIVVLLVFFIIAIVITPWISGALVKVALDYKVNAADETVNDVIVNFISEDVYGAAALETLSDVKAFALGTPLLVLNLIVFWSLMLLFRFVISPLVHLFLLKKIAPKRDADGNKIPFNRWAGLGMGALQGVLIFLFMLIPVTGLMASINKIDRYEPRVSMNVNYMTYDIGETLYFLDNINPTIREINKGIQGSPIGIITSITGMQLVGDLALDHFMTIHAGKTNVHVKREIEVIFELTRDLAALQDILVSIDDLKDWVPIFSRDMNVTYFENVVKKIFRMGVIELVLNTEFGDFIEEADILNNIEGMGDIVDDQNAYNASILKGIKQINANFLCEDVLSILEVVRLVFAEHQIPGVPEQACLYYDIDNLVYVLGNDAPEDDVERAFKTLERTLTKVPFKTAATKTTPEVTRNLAEQIFHVIGNMHIFSDILVAQDNPELHSMPLAKLLGINDPEFIHEGINLNKTMDGLANIIVQVVGIAPDVYSLAGADFENDTGGVIKTLLGGQMFDTIGNILGILLNDNDFVGAGGNTIKVMGTGKLLRAFARDQLETLASEDEGLFGDLLVKAANLLADPYTDKIWQIAIKDTIAEFVEDMINDALAGTPISVDFGDTPAAVLDILLDIIFDDLNDKVDSLGSEGFNDMAGIIAFFGGESKVSELSAAGMIIHIDISLPDINLPAGMSWQELLDEYLGEILDPEFIDALKLLFPTLDFGD